jgi:hypothetical protein
MKTVHLSTRGGGEFAAPAESGEKWAAGGGLGNKPRRKNFIVNLDRSL